MGLFVGGEIADLLAQGNNAELLMLSSAPPISKGELLQSMQRGQARGLVAGKDFLDGGRLFFLAGGPCPYRLGFQFRMIFLLE